MTAFILARNRDTSDTIRGDFYQVDLLIFLINLNKSAQRWKIH